MFKTEGKNIMHDGTPFIMRGFNLGNWMMLERFMFGFPGVDQLFRRYFKYYAGQEKYDWFFDQYYTTYFTESDVLFMKKMGCNTLRIPFNYRVFEDDLHPYEYHSEPLRYIDHVVELCAKHGIYSVIDYHAVQGYENQFHCSDNITGVMELYHNAECQKRCIKLWQYVANHFKDNENVIGYDLINEPGPKDDEFENLKVLYRDLIKGIREVDKDHILFIEGPALSTRFDGMDEIFDYNMGFSPHYYHNGAKMELLTENELWNEIAKDIEIRSWTSEKLKVPCWFGEMGISLGIYEKIRLHCMDITLEQLNQKGYSWSLWTFKDLYRMGLFSTAEDSEWRKQTARFIELKKKYKLDVSNPEPWDCVAKFYENFEQDFPQFNDIKDLSVEGDRMANLKHRVWNNACNGISEILVEDYAKLFANKSQQELSKMIQSFRFENCIMKDDWYQVFSKHMK